MKLTVVKQEKKMAEGEIEYEGCKYKTGEKLVGKKGTWEVQLKTEKKTSKEYMGDDEEYIYEDYCSQMLTVLKGFQILHFHEQQIISSYSANPNLKGSS